MSLPYWIHCNLCAVLLRSGNTNLFLLSCSHLLCKACMQNTNRGTKCPICKHSITFSDLRKCPESHKQNFKSEMYKKFRDPLKAVKFQNAQQFNLVKLTFSFKNKAREASKRHAEIKDALQKRKEQLEKVTQTRRLMQDRLKEMMLQKHKKSSQPANREPAAFGSRNKFSENPFNGSESSTPSSSFKNSSGHPSARTAASSFFNNTPHQQQHIRRDSIETFESGDSMFATKDNHRQTQKARSQLNRNPYFAI